MTISWKNLRNREVIFTQGKCMWISSLAHFTHFAKSTKKNTCCWQVTKLTICLKACFWCPYRCFSAFWFGCMILGRFSFKRSFHSTCACFSPIWWCTLVASQPSEMGLTCVDMWSITAMSLETPKLHLCWESASYLPTGFALSPTWPKVWSRKMSLV